MSRRVEKSIKIKYLLSVIVISILITFFTMPKIEAYFQKTASKNVGFSTKSYTDLTLTLDQPKYSTQDNIVLTVTNPNPYNVSYTITLSNNSFNYQIDGSSPTTYTVNASSAKTHTINITNAVAGNLTINVNSSLSYSKVQSTLTELENLATFAPGPTFNDKLKILTGDYYEPDLESFCSNCLYNYTVYKIKKLDSLPSGMSISNFTSDNIVSSDDSDFPIYAWYELETRHNDEYDYDYEYGTIYYYSEATKYKFNADASKMFAAFSGYDDIVTLDIDIGNIDASDVVDMSYMFGKTSVATLDLSGWNTSKVTDMSHMFRDCTSLVNLNLGNFDTSKVTNMNSMFMDDSYLTSLDLSNFDMSKVVDANNMFESTCKLANITTPKVNSNQTISFYYPMYDQSNNKYIALTSSMPTQTSLSVASIFLDGSYFNTKIKELSGQSGASEWAENTTITSIVRVNTLPSGISIDDFTDDNVISAIGRPIYAWYDNGTIYYYSESTNLYLNHNSSNMFYNMRGVTNIDFTNINSDIVKRMDYMFFNCISLESIDLSNFDLSGITELADTKLFGSTSLISLVTPKVIKNGIKIELPFVMEDSSHNTYSYLTATTPTQIVLTSLPTFLNGSAFNEKLKKLSGQSSATYTTQNTTITSIERVNTLPAGMSISNFTDDNNISASGVPIYAWYDSGIIYYYCESTKLYFNFNSTYMFYNMRALANIDFTTADSHYVTDMGSMFSFVGYNATTLNLDLSNLDTSNVTDMRFMFEHAGYNATQFNLNLSNWDTSNVHNMNYMFDSCIKLTNLNLSSFDMSNVSYATNMLSNMTYLNTLITPKVNSNEIIALTNLMIDSSNNAYNELTSTTPTETTLLLAPTFLNGSSFNQKLKKLSGQSNATSSTLNTAITSIQRASTLPNGISIDTFTDANIISLPNTPPIYAWYDDGVIYYYSTFETLYLDKTSSYMFYNMQGLTNIDFTTINSKFVTTMYYMFYGCSSLTNLNLSNWDTSKVTDMSNMFYGCENLTSLNLSSFDMSALTSATDMLTSIPRLTTLVTPKVNPNIEIYLTYIMKDTSNNRYGCLTSNTPMQTSLIVLPTFLDGISFNTKLKTLSGQSNPTYTNENTTITSIQRVNTLPNGISMNSFTFDNMIGSSIYAWYNSGIIYYYSESQTLYLNADAKRMFYSMKGLTNIDFTNVDSSLTIDMSSMFYSVGYNAATLNLDLSSLDTSKVIDMQRMFYRTGYSATTFNLNLSTWDTQNVTSMYNMFYQTGYSATTWSIVGMSDWDTSNVTNMGYMFREVGYNATTFNLNLSNWNTTNVTSMNGMFQHSGYSATTWSIGDLSGWNISNLSLTGADSLFQYAGYSATTWGVGDLSNWDTSKLVRMVSMFEYAGYNATTWNSIGTLKVYATTIGSIFSNSPKANGTINIYKNPTSYSKAFNNAATSGPGIVVNYSSTTTNIDNIIATKSSNSNVTKGSQLN